MSQQGREVVIVEAVRTPVGRGHPEKGIYKDTHPNDLLGKCYTEVLARSGVDANEVEDVIASGVEHMGHIPFSAGMETQQKYGAAFTEKLMEKHNIVGQGLGAEMIAEQWEIPRSELDELAVRSHRLAHQATEEGRFEREIVPFQVNGNTYVADQGIRPDTSLEALANLKPAFKEDGRITAGNSSP